MYTKVGKIKKRVDETPCIAGDEEIYKRTSLGSFLSARQLKRVRPDLHSFYSIQYPEKE